MKKPILITLCCAGLMLVTPFTTVAQENTVSNNLPEQPNDIEGLVAHLRFNINEKLEKYESKPKLAGFWDLIRDIIFWLFDFIEETLITIYQYIGTIILAIYVYAIALYLILCFIEQYIRGLINGQSLL